MSKVRLHHFDMLKGIAIFMVVMGHVLTMCIRDIDNAVLFKLVEKIHMPIFFFISGYFIYKTVENGKLVIPDILSRIKQLLIPFFVVSTLWIYYFPNSGLQSPFTSTWEGLYFNVGKNGYWFTLCLFELILLYSAIIPVLNHAKSLLAKTIIIICVWLGIWGITACVVPESYGALLGLPMIVEFFPIFMAGALARSVKDAFEGMTKNSKCITVSLIAGSFLMYYVCWSWKFCLPDECVIVTKQLLYICVVIIAIAVVRPWSEGAFSPENPKGTMMSRLWEFLGTKSLAIYLLHYFFLFPMPIFREPLLSMNLNFIPTLIVAAVVASVIIAVTLGLEHIICKSKLLALCFTGKIK